MDFFRTCFKHLLNATAIFGSLLIAMMALSICYQVILRTFFNTSTLWVNDFVEYALLYSTFLGAAYVLMEERHIDVDLIVTKLKPGQVRVIKVITSVLGTIVCAIMAIYGSITVWDNYRRHISALKTIDIPKWIVLAPIAVGFLLLTIQFILRTDDYLRKKEPNAENQEDENIQS